ncbi:MAG: DNA internalization-related competence protein ComEC/Rec2 [Parcubacteria group bacterium Gr01-1014_18]|nr:MAG: DNA internalization-related competence protein ComEC/Rec2 [Parcubacteria group bacterium Greene0416_36]TSC81300.1 MAG: DNA internalization-related competence protein ComEC/Rec2 [Parcubacteria group bacterium Gr01-1014_18]TSC99322.1 MAG: DNA internalization-related competence protein ComEC/Rec2 [Parcubacteria group bacterium Greene1014_20]TSD06841.1 MAG: DNA internalization-related competence protein ComEC/Rec2 [Parcubacteria group bacterium Greene0714_2]
MFLFFRHFTRCVFSFLLGIVCFYALGESALVAGFLCLGVWGVFSRRYLLAGLLLLLFFGGTLRSYADLSLWEYHDNTRGFWGQSVVFRGKVATSKETQSGMSYEIVSLEPFISGRLASRGDIYPRLFRGDIIEARCRVEAPVSSSDFDYARYLLGRKIKSICQNLSWEKIGSEDQGMIALGVEASKKWLDRTWNRLLSPPYSSLVLALVFGDARGLDSASRDLFAKAGLSHILVVSGWHISFFIDLLVRGGTRVGIPKPWKLVPVLAMLLFYLLILDFQSAALRSAIMGVLAFGAALSGRVYDSRRALFFSAGLMSLASPSIIFYDIGFQLSFLATLGILVLEKTITGWIPAIFSWGKIREHASLTIAASIFTQPLLLYYFGVFSPVALLANVLVLPFVASIVLSGLAVTVIAAVWFTLAQYLSILLWLALILLENSIQLLLRIPYAYFDFRLGGVGLLSIYLCFGLIPIVLYQKNKKRV